MSVKFYRSILGCFIFLFVLNAKVWADLYECGIKITSNGTTLVSRTVYLYKAEDLNAGMLTPYRQANSVTSPIGN